MSGTTPRPGLWPREVPPPTPGSTRGEGASEFLSESSAEFEAVRRRATSSRQLASDSSLFSSESEVDESAPVDSVDNTAPDARRVVGLVVAALIALAGLAAWWWSTAPSAPDVGVANSQVPTARVTPVPPDPPPMVGGTLSIETRPAGADVLIDGVARGTTPIELNLPDGSYVVDLRNGGATRRLEVSVEAGTAVRQVVDLAPPARGQETRPATAAAVASPAPPPVEGGWIAFRSPIELQVFERGRRLGTTRTGRLQLAAGPHALELTSDEFEFRTVVTTVVAAGQVLTLPVTVPTGRLFINAVPWADVWIDDRPLGSTPLADIAVPVGEHQVRWRHPEFGERRQTVQVGARTPVRLGMDMTRPADRSTP